MLEYNVSKMCPILWVDIFLHPTISYCPLYNIAESFREFELASSPSESEYYRFSRLPYKIYIRYMWDVARNIECTPKCSNSAHANGQSSHQQSSHSYTYFMLHTLNTSLQPAIDERYWPRRPTIAVSCVWYVIGPASENRTIAALQPSAPPQPDLYSVRAITTWKHPAVQQCACRSIYIHSSSSIYAHASAALSLPPSLLPEKKKHKPDPDHHQHVSVVPPNARGSSRQQPGRRWRARRTK